ncbi:MAG: hypothetical protein LAP86_19160 [Acidobacteriia bacterium]|nr:hypothetical protein [Terriglobia bacterium]
MIPGKSSGLVIQIAVVLISVFGVCPTSVAQGPLPDAPMPVPAVEHGSAFVSLPPPITTDHTFWDRENKVLFFAAAALNGADFAITRSNLQGGGRELNPVVRIFGRSTAGLAVNFAGETAGVVAVSYLFHKTGHHKLERWVSLINISSSAAAVSFDLAHR